MRKLQDDDATVNTTKSSISRMRHSHDDRYERALLSAYGLGSCITVEEVTSYVNPAASDGTTAYEDEHFSRDICRALSSSIVKHRQQQHEQLEKRRTNSKVLDSQNVAYSVTMLSSPQELEMQIAQLNFDVAELRTREEEQILLYDNLKKCLRLLRAEKHSISEKMSRLQESVETMNTARCDDSLPKIEELLVKKTECQSHALRLQNEYDQIILATSKTFQDYKERQSYETELSDQLLDSRNKAKQLATEKASKQCAIEETTQEFDELQMKVDEIMRHTDEALRAKDEIDQQKKQYLLQVDDQKKVNEYIAQKIEEIGNGSCRGRAVSSFEAVMSECPTPRSSIIVRTGRDQEDGGVVFEPNFEPNKSDDKHKSKKKSGGKKPLDIMIQIGENKKGKGTEESVDVDVSSNSSSMSSVTIGTKRSLISTIFSPHVYFPFIQGVHQHHHVKTKKEKELKVKISEAEEETDDEQHDPLTFWKSRQND